MEQKCIRERLLPFFIVLGIISVVSVVWALYYQKNGSLKQPKKVAINDSNLAKPTAFTPPWHNKPADAVTGATPKKVSFNRVIPLITPSVVGINTTGPLAQTGSGVVVNRSGYILTSLHVIDKASSITVTLSLSQGIKSYAAKLIKSNPAYDLAILQLINTKNFVFPAVPIGNSDKIMVGDNVVAIGTPFGLSQTATSGIVSNKGIDLPAGKKTFKGLIQTDASMNPGSSGGPLVNTSAEVVGINMAIYSQSKAFTGIGFAMPINEAVRLFPKYIEKIRSPLVINKKIMGPQAGNVKMIALTKNNLPKSNKPWLGVDVYPTSEIILDTYNVPVPWGILVNQVFVDSPAYKAGMARGDVIFRINNKIIKSVKEMWLSLKGHNVGESVLITLFRGPQKINCKLVLEPEPPNIRSLLNNSPQGQAQGAAGIQGIEEIAWLGIDIQPITAGEAMQEFGVSPNQTGVFIGEVEGIRAIEAGLLPGDVITKINGQVVKDLPSFKDLVRNIDISKGIFLDINRQNRNYFIAIKPIKQNKGAW